MHDDYAWFHEFWVLEPLNAVLPSDYNVDTAQATFSVCSIAAFSAWYPIQSRGEIRKHATLHNIDLLS